MAWQHGFASVDVWTPAPFPETRMKHLFAVLLLALAAIASQAANSNALNIIPAPLSVEMRSGAFRLTAKTVICTEPAGQETGKYLAARLRKSTGYPLFVASKLPAGASPRHAITLTTNGANAELGAEGYEMEVAGNSVAIRAPTEAGLFYGAQSLLQMLPPEIFSDRRASGISWEIPCAKIVDRPRFQWRGLMLDVSRHFFTKSEVERLLDEMALHKLNTFHWHLVDDGGWRIEIKKYPKLTEVGAWREGVGFGLKADASTAYGPDGRYGGFYTQDDIRDVVAYAAARHITVVPEIELPGHSVAALSAHPEFSCNGGPYTPQMQGGVLRGIYCAGKEETFAYLEDVISEVCALFPGKDFHIGGDEVRMENWQQCPRCQARMQAEGLKSEHELQSWFIRRVERMLNARGKNLVGWSEIRQGGLASSAIVMDWIGGGVEAANEDHDVVMTPKDFCYFDYYQSQDKTAEPRAIGGYLPLAKAYAFEPVPDGLLPGKEKNILGAQGNIWTEYIPNFKQVEYMTFPRLCALAEATWSPKSARNWDGFSSRLQAHAKRLDVMGINYRHPAGVTPEAAPIP